MTKDEKRIRLMKRRWRSVQQRAEERERERMPTDQQIRDKYPAVDDAYQQYLMLLALAVAEERDKLDRR